MSINALGSVPHGLISTSNKDTITKKEFETLLSRVANHTMKEIEEAGSLNENAHRGTQSSQRQVNDITKLSLTIKKEPSDTLVAVITEEEVTETENNAVLPLVSVKKEDEIESTPVDGGPRFELIESTTTIAQEEVEEEEEETQPTRMQNITQYINKENVITASKIATMGAVGFYSPLLLLGFSAANMITNKLTPELALVSDNEVLVSNTIAFAACVLYDPAHFGY